MPILAVPIMRRLSLCRFTRLAPYEALPPVLFNESRHIAKLLCSFIRDLTVLLDVQLYLCLLFYIILIRCLGVNGYQSFHRRHF